jgi:hypothetical protein
VQRCPGARRRRAVRHQRRAPAGRRARLMSAPACWLPRGLTKHTRPPTRWRACGVRRRRRLAAQA